MKIPSLYIPTTKADVLKGLKIRVGYCALPYLVLTLSWSFLKDDRFLSHWGFWWCVVLIPGLGLALDLWRLQQTRHKTSPDS